MRKRFLGIAGLLLCAAGACGPLGGLLSVYLPIGGPRTTRPYLQMDAADAVTVVWFTPVPLAGSLEVFDDARPDAPLWTLVEDAPVEQHAIRVSGLEPGKRYSYRLTGEAATDTHLYRLPAPKLSDERITLAVLGDSGMGTPGQRAVADQMLAARPDYIIHTGDVVYPSGADAGYDGAFFSPYADLLTEAVIFPCLGNHDVGLLDGAAYLKNFVLPENGPPDLEPERCYSIDLGNIHLVSIDRTRDPRTMQELIMPWAREDLLASGAAWKLVVFHYPAYQSGSVNHAFLPDDAATWGAFFDETGVDLCLAGHNHLYERTFPLRGGQIVGPGEGTVYIVSGAGGAGLYRLTAPADFSAARDDSTHGFTQLVIEGNTIEIAHISSSGNVLDHTLWQK